MDNKWLEDFLSVARTGSFSRSAAERHITQPAFSRRIKSLEQWVGTPLIDRSTYPTRLTPAGERFRDAVQLSLATLLEVRHDLRAGTQPREATLRMAAQHSLASGFMVAWLQTVQPRLGERAIEVRADNLHDCMRDLDQGNVDALICYAHDALPIEIDVRRFPWHTIADSLMVPVSRPDRQGRPTFSLRRRPTQRLPLLSYGAESYLGRAVWHTIDQLHLRRALGVVYESTLSDSLRAAALAGFGLAWLPLHLVAEDLDRGVLVHAGTPRHEVKLHIRLYRDVGRLGSLLAPQQGS
jgi:DNA-binding transcriptional LysR family regulator